METHIPQHLNKVPSFHTHLYTFKKQDQKRTRESNPIVGGGVLRVACRKVHTCEHGIQEHGGQKPTKTFTYDEGSGIGPRPFPMGEARLIPLGLHK